MERIDSPQPSNGNTAKRKRSPSVDAPTPPVKVAKTHSSHLQINYLARQYQEILPLVSVDDSLPALLSLIGDYDGVLHRHESMAGNLGARPLGPILIKRFERLFDGPPKVLKSHGKEGTTVGWLDVVEFARNKPEQFNLEKMRDGVRVCQFYTKQSRVEITEEDYLLIASGMPQKLIPPQPIVEDEEKELGTLEILEKNLSQVVQLADQVSARARQLNHRLKNRKNAIISRREAEAATSDDLVAHSPSSSGNVRGGQQSNGEKRPSISPTSGFVAVNQRTSNLDVRDDYDLYNGSASLPESLLSGRLSNGTSLHAASAATRAELLNKFFTNSERIAAMDPSQKGASVTNRPMPTGKMKSKHGSDPNIDPGSILQTSGSPVPIPHTPSSLLPYSKSTQQDRFDDSGPYKSDMMARMEQLNRGDRVQPPCDRCRRLHMDCLKNLTACMGCTKKHAKCSWKDVSEQELVDNPLVLRSAREEAMDGSSGGERGRSRDPYRDLPTISHNNPSRREPPREEDRGVRDEELLGEEASGEEEDLQPRYEHKTDVIPSPATAVMTAEHSAPSYSTGHAPDELEQPYALPSPPKEQDNPASAISATGSDHGSRPTTSTDGFQSVNVKGVVVGSSVGTQDDDDDEGARRDTEQNDKERDALIQLSAAAQQVSEFQQQQQQQHPPLDEKPSRTPSASTGEEEEEGRYLAQGKAAGIAVSVPDISSG
ncbi:MAG: hypothetical protein L6R35_003063 [Caloplaca aegaea]|nr:MAG: hypothetical protein L6R35_003063 [Caloplaca aegaea]